MQTDLFYDCNTLWEKNPISLSISGLLDNFNYIKNWLTCKKQRSSAINQYALKKLSCDKFGFIMKRKWIFFRRTKNGISWKLSKWIFKRENFSVCGLKAVAKPLECKKISETRERSYMANETKAPLLRFPKIIFPRKLRTSHKCISYTLARLRYCYAITSEKRFDWKVHWPCKVERF